MSNVVPFVDDGAEHAGSAGEVAERLIEMTQSLNRFRSCVHNAAPGEGEGLLNHLLWHVLEHGPMRAVELAETTQADPSTVSRQVATLVGRGLLERRADPQDGRASLLHVTPAGIAYRRRVVGSRNAHFAELLGDWSEADRRRFVRLLSRFTDDFGRYKGTWLAALSAEQVASPELDPAETDRRDTSSDDNREATV
jgi:DNA-binding MarR family transcriptional regulator